jgi:hypothetical protein
MPPGHVSRVSRRPMPRPAPAPPLRPGCRPRARRPRPVATSRFPPNRTPETRRTPSGRPPGRSSSNQGLACCDRKPRDHALCVRDDAEQPSRSTVRCAPQLSRAGPRLQDEVVAWPVSSMRAAARGGRNRQTMSVYRHSNRSRRVRVLLIMTIERRRLGSTRPEPRVHANRCVIRAAPRFRASAPGPGSRAHWRQIRPWPA